MSVPASEVVTPSGNRRAAGWAATSSYRGARGERPPGRGTYEVNFGPVLLARAGPFLFAQRSWQTLPLLVSGQALFMGN